MSPGGGLGLGLEILFRSVRCKCKANSDPRSSKRSRLDNGTTHQKQNTASSSPKPLKQRLRRHTASSCSGCALTKDTNVFLDLRAKFGEDCFCNQSKVQQIARTVNTYIQNSGSYRQVVISLVTQALAFYAVEHDALTLISHLSPIEFPSNYLNGVLAIAAHLCQKFNLPNTNGMVFDVIKELVYADRGTDRFFAFLDPLITLSEVDQTLYPRSGAESRREARTVYATETITNKRLLVLHYFLEHANNLKLRAEIHEVDFTHDESASSLVRRTRVAFIDAPLVSCRGATPLLLACSAASPAAVLLLLRHGADPLRPGQTHHVISLRFQHPVYVLSAKLNAARFWYETRGGDALDADDLQRCLSHFCRALPRLPVYAVTSEGVAAASVGGKKDRRGFPLHERFFDSAVVRRRTSEPPTLRHLCRCRLRRMLLRRRQLPRGIRELPLPPLLRDYVDLLID